MKKKCTKIPIMPLPRIPPNVSKTSLTKIFTQIEFTNKNGTVELRDTPIVFCKNVQTLISYIKSEKKLNDDYANENWP